MRERSEDIKDLVRHFFAIGEREGLPVKQLQPEALDVMLRYRWPGNVRELENLVRRLAALYPQETITSVQIENELNQISLTSEIQPEQKVQNLSSAMESYLEQLFKEYGDSLPPPGLYHRLLREIEFPLICASLAATKGNQIKTAELLGLNRNTLRKKIKDLEIQVVRGA